jgi:murein DD-endopeptidase MepM/ murein hydrolase activator NlpD
LRSPIITEGKTLLVSINLPSYADSIVGALPVEITPASAKDVPLVEPQPLYFYSNGDGRTFQTILSAPLDAINAETVALKIKVVRGQSRTEAYSFEYRIQKGVYRSSALTLSQSFSSPSLEIAERKQRDFETMVEVYRRRTQRRWQNPFMLPVSFAHRDNFGDRRVVNGTKRYRHAGLDFNAPLGTPVRAVNDGVVALSTEQWTPGQTICLDHGGGVFSKYMHLSKRYVREGDRVSRGDVIALSGQSGGQKPGPHLHLDTVVNGSHVDPIAFMRTASQVILTDGR